MSEKQESKLNRTELLKSLEELQKSYDITKAEVFRIEGRMQVLVQVINAIPEDTPPTPPVDTEKK